jgi:hypothetical protein
VLVRQGEHALMRGDNSLRGIQGVYNIFAVPGVGFTVKKSSICIPRFEPRDATTLPPFDFKEH